MGIERLSKLSNLEELNLGGNNFNNSILSSLAGVSSLKHLDLSGNRFKGVVNIEEFNMVKLFNLFLRLHSVKELDMRLNEIDHFVSPKGLSNLKVISLSHNNLSNSILSSLGGLSSLKYLYLEDIGLNGTVDVEGLCSLKNLEELYIDWNKIDKFVNSKDYRGLKKLNALSLYSGIETTDATVFLQSTLRLFPSLKTLDLSCNSFNRTVITRELHNLTTLEELILDYSELHISFLQTVATCTLLKHLSMRDCELNYISQVQGSIYFRNLKSLDMEQTTLNHNFSQIFKPIISLKKLSLSYCGLNGTLYDQGLCEMVHLQQLNIDNNDLWGPLPPCLANLTSLKHIPSSFGNMSSLQVLDLSKNELAGGIPKHLAIGCFSLEKLVLSNNKLQGHIFFNNMNLINLEELQLDGSHFSGEIPKSLLNCNSLEVLYLNDNHLSGKIPRWIGNLSILGVIAMSNNELEGPIPKELCQIDDLQILDISNNNIYELRLLDLSQNSLYGKIPSCLDFTALHEENGNEGIIHSEVKNPYSSQQKSISYSYKGRILTSMSGIDLSCNKLFGEIPDQIGNLTAIHALNLSHNNLTGSIPITFLNLKQIESLDLSYNDLNGKIPSNLVEIYTLFVFSVAHNNLSGKTPERINQLATFEEGSYLGNPFLCGLPLNKSCNPVESPSLTPGASADNKEDDNDFVDMDIFYITFVVTYIVVLLVIVGILYVNPYWRRTRFYLVEKLIISCYYFVIDHLP
ncbi:receptor-like protein 1 [Pistacia vera]|uniref:receptor-like protein 1 n=1 Tax=Pistacia vera TaxID=55513 RepID=UPI00126336C9|nr:receptor-like protein 1 [Pistacia vera]